MYHSYLFRNDDRNYINFYLRLLNKIVKLKIPYSWKSSKSNRKIVDTHNRYPSTHKYMIVHFPGFMQALNKK